MSLSVVLVKRDHQGCREILATPEKMARMELTVGMDAMEKVIF